MPTRRRLSPVLDEATRQFCEEHTVRLLPFIERLAYRSRLPFPVEDLIQEGAQAVFEALPRWDASRGLKMETWLMPRILGSMQDYARRSKFLKGGARKRVEKIESIDRARGYTDGGKAESLLEVLHCAEPDQGLDWGHLLRGFNKQERLIIIDYFVLNRSMRQIGQSLGYSQTHINQRLIALLGRLRELEESEGRVTESLARAG